MKVLITYKEMCDNDHDPATLDNIKTIIGLFTVVLSADELNLVYNTECKYSYTYMVQYLNNKYLHMSVQCFTEAAEVISEYYDHISYLAKEIANERGFIIESLEEVA